MIGDRRTRKRDVLERLLKQDLTGEVMKKMRKKKEKEAEKEEARKESSDSSAKHGRFSLTIHRNIASQTDKNHKEQ